MSAGTVKVGRLRLSQAPTLSDAVVAGAAFAATLAALAGEHGATRSLDAPGVGLAAIACFPLLVRRAWPLGVFVVTAAATATLSGLGYALGPPFGPTVALFFVAADDRTRLHAARTAAVIVGVFAFHVGVTSSAHSGFPTSPILFGIVVWGGAWMVGDQVRQRRRRRLEVEERLRRAEQEAAREGRLAAAEERTRIARDLHDSAAHAINVILVQAGAARLLQERDPNAVKAALSTIEDVARETIGEIDLLVGGLRENVGSPTVEAPVGLAALDTLVERYRASGLQIEVRVEGRTRLLARRLDQAAFRILQESLTNAARHGDGRAKVAIRYGERELELTISNVVAAAPGTTAGGGGHGILGMRERASLLGGTLDAGREGDAFQVRARLPYGEEAT
ncbi:MAG TPA: histidine kinase [Gaiellaceae bacterium]|nr:histidine kinase [Gaiellaceae bacterium]